MTPRSAAPAAPATSSHLSLQRAFDEELVRMERAVTGAVMIMAAGGTVLTLYSGSKRRFNNRRYVPACPRRWPCVP